jgi:hypothetical protein
MNRADKRNFHFKIFLTTKNTNHTKKTKDEPIWIEPRIARMGTDKSGKAEAGLRPGSRAGAAFSNPSTSELARDSENTSLIRSASIPASGASRPNINQ